LETVISPTPLSFEQLTDAVAHAAAIRIVTNLEPIGGPGDKIFPPTYEGGEYAEELRRVGDREVKTVLLDSVASQANRMELALLAAYERQEIAIPLVVADFTPWFPSVGRVTALEAPHRVYDAIFRDGLLDGVRFRETPVGKPLYGASITNATPLLQLCPTVLIWGGWDSTSLKPGYLGPKFERALSSEIVGFNAVAGQKTSSRIDPLQIESAATVYRAADGWWTADETRAERNEKNEPLLYGKTSEKSKGRPSLIVHGNVTPTIEDGGYTISHAVQTTVLSLIALRRLHFPLPTAKPNQATDLAAQTLLASLALCALSSQRQQGYDLRSRCLLIPTASAQFELIRADANQVQRFSLHAAGAAALFERAATNDAVKKLGCEPREIELAPSDDVLRLVRVSRELGPAEDQQ